MFIKSTLLFASLAIFGLSNGLFAQDESQNVSDEDLEAFVVIYKEVQTENKKIQQKMAGTIQAEGMEIKRFNEINQANANPNKEVEATTEEMEAYNKVTKKVKKMRTDFQQKVKEMINEAEDMTLEKYQEIYAELQKDKSLQKKFGELMNG
tara:strand:+ start:171 stop:623 length:453 start_codon:yes stop_codon:yes gene_type:complete